MDDILKAIRDLKSLRREPTYDGIIVHSVQGFIDAICTKTGQTLLPVASATATFCGLHVTESPLMTRNKVGLTLRGEIVAVVDAPDTTPPPDSAIGRG